MRALPCGHVIDKSKTAVGDDCPYCVQIVERVEEYRADGRAPSRARIEVFNLFFSATLYCLLNSTTGLCRR